MIPKECKRLAEVDFPIAIVGKHSLAEKTRRSGTPHQLHLWWSWKPLSACRAMLLALLLPDPCDPLCPEDFKTKARLILPQVQGTVGPNSEDLRKSLLKFIGDFANYELSADQTYVDISQGLVKAAYPEETPLVVDTFAGGGSVPLEALRLGCETFASDLNPVACLILKTKLVDIPKKGSYLHKLVAETASKIGNTLEQELAEIYPRDSVSSRPISYIWARTIRCESPHCGAEIPLKGSFWLSKKSGRNKALRFDNDSHAPKCVSPSLVIFEPESERDVPKGTVARAKAVCPCCNAVLSPERVRAQLAQQHGGADVFFDENGQRIGGAKLLAVVTVKVSQQGRGYRLPTAHDYEAIWKAQKKLEKVVNQTLPNGIKLVPDEPLPPIGTLGFRVQRYGMLTWKDLFTKRQLLFLSLLASNVCVITDLSIRELLALTVSKLAERNNAICNWMVDVECPGHLFTQQVIPPSWDFAEAVPVGDSSGSFDLVVKHTLNSALSCSINSSREGTVHLCDAQKTGLPDESCAILFTDPPYYNSIPYSDLSDFFFVWLKRALPKEHPLMRDPFDVNNALTPKKQELVQDEAKEVDGGIKDQLFWQQGMLNAFWEARRILRSQGLGCVVFAHKTTEGWEALLEGMTKGGWVITASWPIATERAARVRARDSAALATSIHLVCRPRPENAPVGDWGDVLRELPNRVGDWMERLQSEGIRGADLVFACIGPALEIFSRYSKVETADGREVRLAEYLEKVWEVVGRIALEQVLGTEAAKARNGAAGAVEEDARLTALFLWTLQSTNGEEVKSEKEKGKSKEDGEIIEVDNEDEDESPKGKQKGFTLVFDVVRRFAQPLGIHLPEWEGRIIETKKGVVRLFSIAERAKQLFGEDGAQAVADQLEKDTRESLQGMLFPDVGEDTAPIVKGKRHERKSRVDISKEAFETRWEATTLDRVHAAMLLQASGRANALRSLLKSEQERGPEFLRLANALSALYPKNCEEKRLLDAMLLAVPK
jgi:adenine-specific DNA methylase